MVWIPRDITNAELAVIRVLWNQGSATIRELTDAIYPDGGHSHYATVQSLLDRLDQKGCVNRERRGRVNVFTATISRADLISRRLKETAETLCDGSMAPLLTHLVGMTDLSEDELSAISALIDRLDAGSGSGEQAGE